MLSWQWTRDSECITSFKLAGTECSKSYCSATGVVGSSGICGLQVKVFLNCLFPVPYLIQIWWFINRICMYTAIHNSDDASESSVFRCTQPLLNDFLYIYSLNLPEWGILGCSCAVNLDASDLCVFAAGSLIISNYYIQGWVADHTVSFWHMHSSCTNCYLVQQALFIPLVKVYCWYL